MFRPKPEFCMAIGLVLALSTWGCKKAVAELNTPALPPQEIRSAQPLSDAAKTATVVTEPATTSPSEPAVVAEADDPSASKETGAVAVKMSY